MSETGGYRDRNVSADKALDIMLLFDESRQVLSGTEIASLLGVGKSTAHRYLQSLTSAGFLESSGRSGYGLGFRVLELGRLASKGLNLVDLARPVMRKLTDEVGESSLLARRTGRFTVCLAHEECSQPVRTTLKPGDLLPVNAGAPGLVLLAWAAPEEIDWVIEEGVERFTEQTVTAGPLLRERLAVIRSHGFAISRGEFTPGILGIGAPVRDGAGQVIAAVSIVALQRRVPDERVPAIVEQVKMAADEITEQFELLS